MKNTSIFRHDAGVAHAGPCPLAAQAPAVLRDRKGTIQAIEFSEKDAASSLSDQAFVKQYLLVTADDF